MKVKANTSTNSRPRSGKSNEKLFLSLAGAIDGPADLSKRQGFSQAAKKSRKNLSRRSTLMNADLR